MPATMAKPSTIRLPYLYPKQRAAFFGPERVSCCEATTKAGKSVGALTWLIWFGIERAPGCALLWCSPVYSQAKVMFERLLRWLTDADSKRETGWSENRTDLTVTLPGGAVVWFKGSDKPDTIYGADYSAVVVDEASRCREEAWHAVRSTTTATRGPIRLIGNVRGRRNWAYKLARKAEAGEPDMSYHRITAQDAVDAGILDAQEIEDARRHLPEAVFRELYEALASDDAGNPFGDLTPCVAPLSTATPAVWGIDLAKSQDWAVAIALDHAGRACRFERWQSPWEETISRIRTLIGGTRAFIDSTGVGDPIVEQLQRQLGDSVVGFKFSPGSKQQLMEGLSVAIQQRRISFPEGPIVAELEAFEYEYTRTGVRYSAPAGMHDDCVCALALAVSGLSAGPIEFSPDNFAFPRALRREEMPWD